jgi:hypothetical protein
MNTNLLNALKEIVSQYGGVETLSDARRVKALLADLAAAEPRPQKNALIACLEGDFAAMLQNVPAHERGAAKSKLAERLNREEGLDAALCADTLDLLEAVVVVAEEAAAEQREAKKTPQQPVPADSDTASEASNVASQNYEEKCGEVAVLKKRLKKTKNGLTAAIVIGSIALIISITVGYSKYSLMESALWSANYSREQLLTERTQLQTELGSLVRINVTRIKVGNWGNGSWLTRPGEALYAAQMRYFNPVITYNAVLDGEITFYIKIIQPDGTLHRNPSVSPVGYSFSTTARINRGSNQTLDLSGWGNSSSSSYWAGTWTVEVWFNNGCLRSEKVTINR